MAKLSNLIQNARARLKAGVLAHLSSTQILISWSCL